MGDGWSIAWRVHDAQFWGVPQRRKRIALVADFGGLSATEVLFERKGLRWYPEQGAEAGQGVAAGAEGGAGGAISFQERAGKPGGGKGILIQDERTGALSTLNNQSVLAYESNKELSGTVGFTNRGYESGELAETPRAEPHGAFPMVAYGIDQQGGKGGANYQKDKTPPILSDSHGTPHAVAYSIQGNTIDRDAKQNGSGLSLNVAHTIDAADRHGVFAVDVRNVTENPHINGTLQAKEQGISYNLNNVVRVAADVYNQTMDAETAPTVTAAVGGTNTSGPKVVEISCGNPWDSQSERVYHGDGARHSLNANSGGGQNRDAVLTAIPINTMVGTRDSEEKRTTFGIGEDGDPQFTISAAHEHAVFAFTQNQRDEVRDLKDIAGSLAAEPGMKQQTFVAGFSFGQSEKMIRITEHELSESDGCIDSGSASGELQRTGRI